MPTPHFRSQLAAALLGLLGTAFLVNSLSVHPQDKGDKASPTQSKESSSGSSSGAGTTQGGAAGAGGMSSTTGASKLSQSDERMIKQIAEANLAEISAGKIAQDKAQSEEVKSFAKKMVDDHTKALDDLKQLAQSKGVTLPTEPDKQHMAMEKKLQALSGEKFDKQYLQQSGDRAHKETHRLLQRASSRAEDADLKNYASKVIATVESHQQMAKDTSRNLKSTAEGKSGGGTGAAGGAQGGESSGKSGHGKSKSGKERSSGSSMGGETSSGASTGGTGAGGAASESPPSSGTSGTSGMSGTSGASGSSK